MSAACSTTPIATTALDLPREQHVGLTGQAALLAWRNDVTVVIVGRDADGELVLCTDGCCRTRPRVVVVAIAADLDTAAAQAGDIGLVRFDDGRAAYAVAGSSK